MSKNAKPDKRERVDVGSPQNLSLSKRRLFRWSAALLVPALILLITELALRLFGMGYPTHFFVQSDTGPPGLLAENEKFGWRFFPRRLARAPDPVRLTKNKPPNTCRIFVLGESAALGDPAPAYGFSRILRELLEARWPGLKFEVINTAMTAINSHAILSIARDCVPLQGDYWIIYMGNNEVVGPFGAGSVFGAKSPPLPIIRASLALKRTCLGQQLAALWQRLPVHSDEPTQWEGMKMMLDQQIRADDPALKRLYDNFKSNLDDILSTAIHAGAKPIVCCVSSNLKDCPPFASLHRSGLSSAQKSQFDALLSTGADLESKAQSAQALDNYRQAAGIDDTYAALAFRIARCYQALGQLPAARDFYTRSRDLDALRFRADAPINRIIRDVSARRATDGAEFFDAEAAVTNACKQGIPGEDCFWDHVHFNFRGNYCLARALAERVTGSLPQGLRGAEAPGGAMLSEDECAQRLAYTLWDQRSTLQEMLRRVQEPPFTAQLNHEELLKRWSSLVSELDQKLGPEGNGAAVAVYTDALKRRPEDWLLHHRLAFLLEASGDLTGASYHWQTVTKLVPEYVEAWFKLGDISVRQNKPVEAELYFRRVLALRPTSFEAMNSLGLLLGDRGKLDEANRLFEQALLINPKFAQVHLNWGLLELRRGDQASAEAHYREALRCEPDNPSAHINLGNLLAAQQKHPEAIAQYLQALTVRSNESTLHFALANSLAAVGRNPEAVAHYQQAISLNPGMAEAHFNLGLCQAKAGDVPAATSSFQEAARLNPNDIQAHLNLGVALARQNRMQEAIFQFEDVLRLDPANADAVQYLERAKTRAGPGN